MQKILLTWDVVNRSCSVVGNAVLGRGLELLENPLETTPAWLLCEIVGEGEE